MLYDLAQLVSDGQSFEEPVRIYCGMLGQIGDIVMFTPTLRRLKEIFPHSFLTFAVSRRYREAGLLIEGLPYVDRLFVTEFYFERLDRLAYGPWHLGWPVDLRGEDEVAEQRRHHLALETRPRHRRMPWWQYGHATEECAHMVGVPGPIDPQTEVRIPRVVEIPPGVSGKVVLHNDPSIDERKAWPWDSVRALVRELGSDQVVLLGSPGPEVKGAIDLRGETSLLEAVAVIDSARCYLGIDSGLMWIAASLKVPTVGLYGGSYVPAGPALHPRNPNATYLQAVGDLAGIPPEQVLEVLETALRRTEKQAGRPEMLWHPAL